MTRDEGRAKWQLIAARQFTPEVLEWLAQVAPLVLEADRITTANDRRLGIVEAVGLKGRVGTQTTALVKEMDAHLKRHPPEGTSSYRRQVRDATMALVLNVNTDPVKGVDRDAMGDRVRRRLKK